MPSVPVVSEAGPDKTTTPSKSAPFGSVIVPVTSP